jgi:hypothetical protein
MRAGFLCGNLKEIDHLEDLGVYGRVILKWILRKIGCEDMYHFF